MQRVRRSLGYACLFPLVTLAVIPAFSDTHSAETPEENTVRVLPGPVTAQNAGLEKIVHLLSDTLTGRGPGAWPARLNAPDASITLQLRPPESGQSDETFHITTEPGPDKAVRLVLTGGRPRALLYAAGWILRNADRDDTALLFPPGIRGTFAPAWPIRGHQLGYRATANSYDAWDDTRYERYILDLALFGANAIENIPFQDDKPAPLMPLPRQEMNRRISEICQAYDLEYWVWTPATFSLDDAAQRAEELDRHEALYAACPTLSGVFFPGGDPGDNPPERVIPFLEDLATRLEKYHPDARVWLSLQGYRAEWVDAVYAWIERDHPAWLGGLVGGPSSPPLAELRARLPKEYRLRDYPDITHTVRCQYPVPWWDPAFALTLGREPINPRPLFYADVHRQTARFTDGFIAYSDGIHDDVNKAVYSALAWDPSLTPREILRQYARLFFGPDTADAVADGILALERNWEGPLAENGSVATTAAYWRQLNRQFPSLCENWRWNCLLLRAEYDEWTRKRLLYEQSLEARAMDVLYPGSDQDPRTAMDNAESILQQAETRLPDPAQRERIIALFETLFKQIGLQSSVERYGASGHERGCSLDFLEYPLNNRWWLIDRFQEIRQLTAPSEQWRQIRELRDWESPVPGALYDDTGHVGRCPRVLMGSRRAGDRYLPDEPIPTQWWWDNGFSRRRLSWQCTMDWPRALVYEGLNPEQKWIFRCTGYGDVLPRADGVPLNPTRHNREIGGIKEFPVPPELTRDGSLRITFDPVPNEENLNWRQQSRLAETWLIPDAENP